MIQQLIMMGLHGQGPLAGLMQQKLGVPPTPVNPMMGQPQQQAPRPAMGGMNPLLGGMVGAMKNRMMGQQNPGVGTVPSNVTIRPFGRYGSSYGG